MKVINSSTQLQSLGKDRAQGCCSCSQKPESFHPEATICISRLGKWTKLDLIVSPLSAVPPTVSRSWGGSVQL